MSILTIKISTKEVTMDSKSAQTPHGQQDGKELQQSSFLNKGEAYVMKAALRRMMLTLGLTIALASVAPSAFAQGGGASGSAPAGSSDSGQKMTVRTGYLTCHEASGWGFIFGSSRKLRCAYARNPNYTEYYDGSITDFGADIGYLQSGVILWAVAAPTTDLGPGALAGHYGGATASAAIGVGAGANVLLGGFKHSIALQPVSIEGENGLNVAAGIAELSLKLNKNKPPKTT
jgi:hypothetical protein